MTVILNKNPDKVVDHVFEAILKNRLKPGVKLSEISLQEEFGYSRAVVRQGFDKLVDSGVLIHKKMKVFESLILQKKNYTNLSGKEGY